mgnify:CR=1 FL=1
MSAENNVPNIMNSGRYRLPTEVLLSGGTEGGIGNIIPAYTNTYDVYVKFNTANGKLVEHIKKQGFESGGDIGSYLSLFCSEAVLPGSSIETQEISGLRQGVKTSYATYRAHPQINLTYYTQKDYYTNAVFDGKLDFISPVNFSNKTTVGNSIDDGNAYITSSLNDAAAYRRMRYPEEYKCEMQVSVFPNEYLNRGDRLKEISINAAESSTPSTMTYFIKNAFPTNIVSAPLEYGDAALLKTTVTFAYDFYVTRRYKAQTNL